MHAGLKIKTLTPVAQLSVRLRREGWMPLAAAGEQELPRVHVAFVAGGLDGTFSTQDCVELGIGHFIQEVGRGHDETPFG